jgi:hypothetical protein
LIRFSYTFNVKNILLALLICLALTSGCDSGSYKSRSDELTSKDVDFKWKTDEYGNRFIAGTLINNTGNEYAYVEVEFNLYDGSGEQVGSTFTNMNNLIPNGTWNFEAVVIEDKAREAKLKGVTGF